MSALEEDAETVHVSLRGQVVDDGLLGGGPFSNHNKHTFRCLGA